MSKCSKEKNFDYNNDNINTSNNKGRNLTLRQREKSLNFVVKT